MPWLCPSSGLFLVDFIRQGRDRQLFAKHSRDSTIDQEDILETDFVFIPSFMQSGVSLLFSRFLTKVGGFLPDYYPSECRTVGRQPHYETHDRLHLSRTVTQEQWGRSASHTPGESIYIIVFHQATPTNNPREPHSVSDSYGLYRCVQPQIQPARTAESP